MKPLISDDMMELWNIIKRIFHTELRAFIKAKKKGENCFK